MKWKTILIVLSIIVMNSAYLRRQGEGINLFLTIII
jgi:hypothetical protein